MNSLSVALLGTVFVLASCAKTPSGVVAGSYAAGRTKPRVIDNAPTANLPDDSHPHPHNVVIGQAVYPLENETELDRLNVQFVRWTAVTTAGVPMAIFRVRNTGSRLVLVSNVRKQVLSQALSPGTEPSPTAWRTVEQGYPENWDRAEIPAGEEAEFLMLPPLEGDWRACLLYSRQLLSARSAGPRQWVSFYESNGPRMPQPPFPDPNN